MESMSKSCMSTSAINSICLRRTGRNVRWLRRQNIRFNSRYMRHCRKGIWSESSKLFVSPFVYRAGSRQPPKEADDKNRRNDRRPPRLDAERRQGSRSKRCDDKHDGACPRYGADQAQSGKSHWRNTRVRARDRNCDSQARQKTQAKEELRCMLAHARLNNLSPARDAVEPIQPLPCMS